MFMALWGLGYQYENNWQDSKLASMFNHTTNLLFKQLMSYEV